MKQITKKQAILIIKSELWQDWSDKEKVTFQLFQKRLAMPWDIFHEAVENCLGRPVYSHEFANLKALQNEFLGKKSPPTIENVIRMIPKNKRFILGS